MGDVLTDVRTHAWHWANLNRFRIPPDRCLTSMRHQPPFVLVVFLISEYYRIFRNCHCFEIITQRVIDIEVDLSQKDFLSFFVHFVNPKFSFLYTAAVET